jgi:lipopolysaccharide export system permease protein
LKLKQYLFSQLAITFFPIFLGLFFITSVVFLVKIASLTSIITINFSELFTLFSYVIPQIIFFTLPVSFFLSLVITLAKLASEYELTVITSFGLNPINILKVFLPITLAVSAVLLIVSVGLIPKTKFLTKQFLDEKKKEANFNVKASEFGQKFGEWLIYISDKNDKQYEEVKLFKTDNNQDQFIVSKTAILYNENNVGTLSFKLNDGKAFIINEKEFDQIDFKSMYINESISDTQVNNFTNSYEYWKNNIKIKADLYNLAFYILTSFFPLMSLFLVISFGYYNPRYEKNKAIFYSLFSVVIYYILLKFMSDRIFLHTLYIIPPFWIILTYVIYSKTIKKEY